eukprot:1686005-Amphidinium_carterae.1
MLKLAFEVLTLNRQPERLTGELVDPPKDVGLTQIDDSELLDVASEEGEDIGNCSRVKTSIESPLWPARKGSTALVKSSCKVMAPTSPVS